MNGSGWIIGIDLCEDYSQISFYDIEKDEPASLKAGGDVMIPVLLWRAEETDAWLAGTAAGEAASGGDGITVKPLDTRYGHDEAKEYIKIFISSIIKASGIDDMSQIGFLTVTCRDNAPADIIDEVLIELVGRGRSLVQSHLLSYEYYVFSQKIELWSRDTGLFEYDSRGLRFTYLSISAGRRPALVRSEEEDLSDYLSASGYDEMEAADKDRSFRQAVRHVSGDRRIGSFYLTGAGFEGVGEGGGWMSSSLSELCAMRRHVFVGQNLYARGACYSSFYELNPDRRPHFINDDTELTVYDLFFVTSVNNKESVLPIIQAQKCFRRAQGTACIIPDDTDEIPLYSRNIITGEVNVYTIRTGNVPKRPNKTLRLTADAVFTGRDSCRITLKDSGFGELFPPSGLNVEQEIDLRKSSSGETSSGGRLIAAAPFGQPGLEMRLSGLHVYSTDELSWFVFDNVYLLPDDFFDEIFFRWLDIKTGSGRLSSSLRRISAGRPLSDPVRSMLNAFGYLSAAEVSSVCASLQKLEKSSPLEQSRIKADSLCRYGSYLEALKLYHHTSWAMEHGQVQVIWEFKARIWHNMAVCLMGLHDTHAAADCMYRAYRCGNDQQFLSEYFSILYMSGKEEEIPRIIAREGVSSDLSEQAAAQCRSASRAYEDSERCLGLRAGLALKDMPDNPAYREFIDGYISAQCRQYGLRAYGKNGGFYAETVSGTVQQES